MLVTGRKKHRKREGKAMARHYRKALDGMRPPRGEELCDPHPRGVPRALRLVRCRRRCCRLPSHYADSVIVTHPYVNAAALPLTRLCVHQKLREIEAGREWVLDVVLGQGERGGGEREEVSQPKHIIYFYDFFIN